MHSAVRIQGKRLYEFAREGREIDRAPRRIEITGLARESLTADELVITVECSKGTYIRTLAVDLGRALGCGAHLAALRRTTVGPFRLDQATTLEALDAAGVEAARSGLLPVEVLVQGLPSTQAGPEVAVFGPGRRFLGVGSAAGDRLAPLRLMATEAARQAP
jgi:tRNA pseudouridine55 synthase